MSLGDSVVRPARASSVRSAGPTAVAKPKAHLILGCTPSAAGTIADYTTRLGGNSRVISNDPELVERLRVAGADAVLILDVMPVASEPDLTAYADAYAFVQQVVEELGATTYRGVPLSAAVGEWVFNTIVMMNKAFELLSWLESSHDHAVFAMGAWEHSYLALWDLAQSQGRTEVGDLVLTVRHGRIAPWSDYSERRIEARVAATQHRGALTFHDLLDTCRRVGADRGLQQIRRDSERRVSTLFFLRTNEYVLYLKPIFPIFELFRARNEPYSALTVDPLVVKQLAPMGIDPVLLQGLGDDTSDPSHLRLLHTDALRRLRETIEKATVRLRSRSEFGSAAMRYCTGDSFQRRVLEDLRLIDSLIAAIRRQRPRTIMVAPDVIPSSHVATAVAARFGVPTVTTLAGSVSSHIRHMGVYSADVIAIAGQDDLDAFLAAGYDLRRLILTGSPMFDRITTASPSDDLGYVLQRIPIDPTKRVVVIASSRIDPNEPMWIQAFGQAAQRRGDVQIVVKCHPNYPLERYADSIDACVGLPVHFIRDIDLHPLLDISSAVVTDYSHSGKEALLFGKPLIVFNMTGTPYPTNHYDQLGLALLVTEIEAIGEAFDRILDDQELLQQLAKARNEIVVKKYNHLNDGHAAERIFDLLVRDGAHAAAGQRS